MERHGDDTDRPDIEQRFLEHSDIAQQFGADIDVKGPAPDDAGFFIVKRQPTADPAAFRSWLLDQIGGKKRVLLETRSGVFVVWARFGEAFGLRDAPTVALVGGISIDMKRFQQMLGRPP